MHNFLNGSKTFLPINQIFAADEVGEVHSGETDIV